MVVVHVGGLEVVNIAHAGWGGERGGDGGRPASEGDITRVEGPGRPGEGRGEAGEGSGVRPGKYAGSHEHNHNVI